MAHGLVGSRHHRPRGETDGCPAGDQRPERRGRPGMLRPPSGQGHGHIRVRLSLSEQHTVRGLPPRPAVLHHHDGGPERRGAGQDRMGGGRSALPHRVDVRGSPVSKY